MYAYTCRCVCVGFTIYPTMTKLFHMLTVEMVLSFGSKRARSITALMLACASGGRNHLLFVCCFFMDKWWGFVFGLCSLTSFPPPPQTTCPEARIKPIHSQKWDPSPKIQWSYWNCLQMCADAVSIKRIVLYIKNPCSLCNLGLALPSVWLWNFVRGKKEIKKKKKVSRQK